MVKMSLGVAACCVAALVSACDDGGDPERRDHDDAAVLAEDTEAAPDESGDANTDTAADETRPTPPTSQHDAGTTAHDAAAPDAAQSANVDISKTRLTETAQTFCASAFACDPEMARKVFNKEAGCRQEVSDLWSDDIEFGGADCGDAQLDLYECYAKASCEGQATECVAQEERAETVCPVP